MTSTATSASSATSRQRKFFPFEPEKFLADVQNAVDDYVADASQEVQEALLSECISGDDEEGRGQDSKLAVAIRRGTDEMHRQLVEKFSAQFALLAKYSQANIFAVDDDLIVPSSTSSDAEDGTEHGEGAASQLPDEADLDQEIRAKKMQLAKLTEEEKGLAARKEQLDKFEKIFETHAAEIAQLKDMFGSQGKSKIKFNALTKAANKLKIIQTETQKVQKTLEQRSAGTSIRSPSGRKTRSSSKSKNSKTMIST